MPMPASFNLTAIKRYSYLAAFGSTTIAPLAEAPKIEGDARLYESLIYENGGQEAVASLLTKNSATITLRTKDIETALTLLAAFSGGADVFASAQSKVLSFTPITTATEKVLSFTNAFLLPELSYVPGMGSDHVATLVFKALPDTTTGKLFTFA